jgi:large exoprotein involved in heme utilization and adhesion
VTISGTSRLHTLTGSDGSAGDIIINAVRFTLTDHANLNADTFGSKGAGTITITATDHVTVSGLSTRVSSSSDNGATGDAGKITVSAPTVMIENGGSISTSTTGEGAGGNINILAGQSVTITNDSRLSASSTGPGNAGNILINAGRAFVVTNSKSAVTTQADTASGGNITVLATDRVHLTNSHISASVADGSGGGGNISIDPQSVILQNSQILAQAAQGQGGAITITTNLFLPDANSIVNADSGSGLNGTVTIQSPNAPASGKIQPLGNTPLQATSLLNQHCAALAGGEFSSFTVAGRDSLPTEPGSWLASPLALRPAELSTASVTESGKQARGVIDLAQDTTVLSLRQIAPPGFLTQAFPMDWLAGCTS